MTVLSQDELETVVGKYLAAGGDATNTSIVGIVRAAEMLAVQSALWQKVKTGEVVIARIKPSGEPMFGVFPKDGRK